MKNLLNPKKWSWTNRIIAVIVLVGASWGGWSYYQTQRPDYVTPTLASMTPGSVQLLNTLGDVISLNVRVGTEQTHWQQSLQRAGVKTVQDSVVFLTGPRDRSQRFSASNLKAPVEVAFFDGEGTLLGISLLEPGSTRTVGINARYRHALKAPVGFFSQHGISMEGDGARLMEVL